MPADRRLSSIIALAILGLAGCAGGPGAPAAPSPAAVPEAPRPPAAADPHTGLVAAFRGTLDPTAGTLTLEPVERAGSAIGDTFSEVGLTPAFTGRFGRHFWAEAIRQPSPTTLEVDFAVRHPFTADRRPDLAIFNMKLWVAPALPSTTVAGVQSTPGFVTNPDGYGDMWRQTATDVPGAVAEVQPYVILHEDPSSGPFDWRNPAGWNVLFPGQASVDTVALDLTGVPAGPIDLHLFLTADYGQSAVRATRQDPQYSLPEFAGNAPWKVQVTELANTLEEGNTASTADYRLDIWDWKHGQGLGSDVSSVQVFAPDLMPAPLTPALAGTGTDPDPLTANFTLVNNLNAPAGDHWGLVAASDSATGVALMDDLVTPVSATYTTYQWFKIAVADMPAVPPTAAITRCVGGDIAVGINETFSGATSTPGSHPITTYEWDLAYDGTTFDVDATGVTVDHAFIAAGPATVGLRASDGFGNSDIETVTLTVNATAVWTPLTRLTTNNFWERYEDQSEISPALVTTPDGTVHLFWFDVGAPPNRPFKVVHQVLERCGTFGPEDIVYQNSSQAFGNVTAVATPDGTLHVSLRPPGTVQYSYTNNSGGSWVPPSPITTTPSSGSGSWGYGVLAATGDGQLGFLGNWRRNQNPGAINNGGIPAIPNENYFSRLSGGTWTAIELIGTSDNVISFPSPGSYSSTVASQTLAGTATGDWIAVWQTLKTPHTGGPQVSSLSNLRWNRTTGGAWGTQSTLYSAASDHDRCVLTRAPNGTIFLAVNNGSTVNLATYDGATWSPALTTVFSGVVSSAYSYMAFDAAGQGMITTSGSSSGSTVWARRFMQADTPAAVSAAPLMTPSPSTPGIYQRFPSVAARGDGRFTIVVSTSRYGAIFDGLELEHTTLQ
ncbi:MAG TPA: PKD domain-containing protein [bacterium]|nr:PKD domain-containing protein [bacterium]